MGFIGGRPRSAHYFVATRGSLVYFLDPHTTQPCTSVHTHVGEGKAHASWHCDIQRRMLLKDIDASLTFGFYCKDEADLDDMCRRIGEVNTALGGYAAGNRHVLVNAEASCRNSMSLKSTEFHATFLPCQVLGDGRQRRRKRQDLASELKLLLFSAVSIAEERQRGGAGDWDDDDVEEEEEDGGLSVPAGGGGLLQEDDDDDRSAD